MDTCSSLSAPDLVQGSNMLENVLRLKIKMKLIALDKSDSSGIGDLVDLFSEPRWNEQDMKSVNAGG